MRKRSNFRDDPTQPDYSGPIPPEFVDWPARYSHVLPSQGLEPARIDSDQSDVKTALNYRPSVGSK